MSAHVIVTGQLPDFQPKNRVVSKRHLHFLAAGSAAAFSSALYNPLDCLRVRWQVATTTNTSISQFGIQILQQEGLVKGLWRPGLGANAAGMALSSAIRFGYYESVRDAFLLEEEQKSYKHMVLAGLVCGSMGYVVTTPFHYLKTRIQAERALYGSNAKMTDFFAGVQRIVQESGLTSLYRGVIPLGSRGSLFTAGQMMGYDGVKTVAKSRGHQDGIPLHVAASVAASFGASVLSAPADLIMAKYMASTNKSLRTCVYDIYHGGGGMIGFWRGWTLFFIRLTPVMLTFSTVYEQLRNNLGLGYLD